MRFYTAAILLVASIALSACAEGSWNWARNPPGTVYEAPGITNNG